MKNVIKNIKFVIIIIVIGTTPLTIPPILNMYREYKIEIGQKYSYTLEKDNPFEIPQTRYYKVIDKKDGYVQYVDTVDLDTMSSSVGIFLWGSKLMK